MAVFTAIILHCRKGIIMVTLILLLKDGTMELPLPSYFSYNSDRGD